MRTRVSLPLSVLVLSLVAALALGTAGSATASGITRSTVKKLAAKVVDKKAASLSVAHAATADSATSATTATTATSAGNSAQLDGKAPATFLDRSAHAFLTGTSPVAGGSPVQVMNPLGITVPAGVGYLHVTATATFAGGAANVRVWPSLDGACAESGGGYSHSSVGNTTVQVTVPIDYLAQVAPGNHSVRLCVTAGSDTFVALRSMTITTVASDSNG
ncbi:hypothetical protein [Nocardioides halotolerans]|jgi:hypothetical protein|uniref:hypothetical protein n=1 Tax=Nocardioides halotolerans TaxID=433660 RepID=UPI00040273F5|nr:hypothetical protein [Nocardioides halotolerans]